MTHLAFGTNDKRQVIFGSTGSKLEEYNGYGGHKWIKDDIGHCTRGHGGGYLAESFLNNAQLLDQSGLSVIKAFLLPHKRSGGPEFADFPSHLMGAHQQMHVTQIRRNYEGGLRLMVALVTDNWGPEFLTGVAENGIVPLTCEKGTIRKQMQGFTDLVKLNSSWMEIATS